jgi:hypothetical protein
MLVEYQVGDELFKPLILLLELLEAAQFDNAHTGKFPFPTIKGYLVDTNLAAYFSNGSTALNLAQSGSDLLFRKRLLGHFLILSGGSLQHPANSRLKPSNWISFWGGGQFRVCFEIENSSEHTLNHFF